MDRAIEALVQACRPCQSDKNAPSTSLLHPWLRPSKPWVHIHVEFAGTFQKMFLLIVDSHSKWPQICNRDVQCHCQQDNSQTEKVFRYI